MIQFQCPSCQQTIRAHESVAGRHTKCPRCKAPVVIPAAVAAVAQPSLTGGPPSHAAAGSGAQAAHGPRPDDTPPATARHRTPGPVARPVATTPTSAVPIAAAPIKVLPPAGMPPVFPSTVPSMSSGVVEVVPPTSSGAPPAVSGPPPVSDEPPQPTTMVLSLDDLFAATPSSAPSSAQHVGATATHAAKPTSKAGKIKPATLDPARQAAGIRKLSLLVVALGLVGLGLFWLPYAGLAVGALGCLAALIALAKASSRRGLPKGLAAVGLLVNLAAAGLGAYWTLNSSGQATPEVAAADQTNKAPATPAVAVARRAEKQSPDFTAQAVHFAEEASAGPFGGLASEHPIPVLLAESALAGLFDGPSRDRAAAGSHLTLYAQDGSSGTSGAGLAATSDAPPGSDASARPAAGAPTAPADIRSAAADQGEAQGNDDVQVTVDHVTFGKVELTPPNVENELLAPPGQETIVPYLVVWLKIKNTQLTSPLNYKSWPNDAKNKSPDAPLLVDDSGKPVAPMPGNKDGMIIFGSHSTATIAASQTIIDAVAFYPPADGAKFVRLTLPGKPLELETALHFQIPRAMFKEGPSANVLLPSQ